MSFLIGSPEKQIIFIDMPQAVLAVERQQPGRVHHEIILARRKAIESRARAVGQGFDALDRPRGSIRSSAQSILGVFSSTPLWDSESLPRSSRSVWRTRAARSRSYRAIMIGSSACSGMRDSPWLLGLRRPESQVACHEIGQAGGINVPDDRQQAAGHPRDACELADPAAGREPVQLVVGLVEQLHAAALSVFATPCGDQPQGIGLLLDLAGCDQFGEPPVCRSSVAIR